PHLLSLLRRAPPRPSLFPYTTLFRSAGRRAQTRGRRAGDRAGLTLTRAESGGQPARPGVRRRPRRSSRRSSFPAPAAAAGRCRRSEEHTSELQSRENLVCRLLLEKKK